MTRSSPTGVKLVEHVPRLFLGSTGSFNVPRSFNFIVSKGNAETGTKGP